MSSQKKKVLYVSHGHPDFAAGGGELAALYMYNAMKDSDEYEPYLVARCSHGEIRSPGTHLITHDQDDHCLLIYSNIEAYGHLFDTFNRIPLDRAPSQVFREALLRIRPDIIHFHHYTYLGVDWLRYAKKLLPDVRVFLTLHEMMAICPHGGSMLRRDTGNLCFGPSIHQCKQCFPEHPLRDFLLRDRWYRMNLSVVERFITPSEFLRGLYCDWGIDEHRIEFFDNGRPIWERPERPPRTEGLPLIVGFFGQIVFHKGADILLQAAREYLRRWQLERELATAGVSTTAPKLPEVRFIIHGGMQHLPEGKRQEVEGLLAECREIVTYKGPYTKEQVVDLFKSVDCIVVPSIWWENSPLTIQEAFMAGVPVICSNVGGMAEKVTDRVNGLHFLLGDHFDLLDKIIELAENPGLYNQLVDGIPAIKTETEMARHMHELYGATPPPLKLIRAQS